MAPHVALISGRYPWRSLAAHCSRGEWEKVTYRLSRERPGTTTLLIWKFEILTTPGELVHAVSHRVRHWPCRFARSCGLMNREAMAAGRTSTGSVGSVSDQLDTHAGGFYSEHRRGEVR